MQRSLLLVLILCSFGAMAQAQISLVHPKYLEGNTYAVVVGVSDYLDDKLDLSVADKDAHAVEHWLRTEGFPPLSQGQIRVLTNHQATKANILTALARVALLANEKDRIIFFFSGHGAPEGLAPADLEVQGGANLLLHSEVKSILRSSRSSQILLMIDACHAGANESAIYRGAVNDLLQGYANSGMSMLLSSNPQQYSREFGEVGLSFFTHYLLQGIMKGYANKNGDNLITIEEAFQYVQLNVQVMTSSEQTPQKGGDFDPSIVMRMF